jgi:hypothetical protein
MNLFFKKFLIENALPNMAAVLSDNSLSKIDRLSILGDFLYDSTDEVDRLLGSSIQNLVNFYKTGSENNYRQYLQDLNSVENKLNNRGYWLTSFHQIHAPKPPIDKQGWNLKNVKNLNFYKSGILNNIDNKFLNIVDVKDYNYIRLYIFDKLRNYKDEFTPDLHGFLKDELAPDLINRYKNRVDRIKELVSLNAPFAIILNELKILAIEFRGTINRTKDQNKLKNITDNLISELKKITFNDDLSSRWVDLFIQSTPFDLGQFINQANHRQTNWNFYIDHPETFP